MDIPDSMKAELAEWNGGKGIDLHGYVCGLGNFRLAVGYSTVFWPKFEAREQYILVEGSSDEIIHGFELQEKHNAQSVEAVLNHLHLEDIQACECDDISADKLLFLGQTLKEIYEAKLAWQFPDRPCTVKLYIPDDPSNYREYQITFWQNAHVTKLAEILR